MAPCQRVESISLIDRVLAPTGRRPAGCGSHGVGWRHVGRRHPDDLAGQNCLAGQAIGLHQTVDINAVAQGQALQGITFLHGIRLPVGWRDARFGRRRRGPGCRRDGGGGRRRRCGGSGRRADRRGVGGRVCDHGSRCRWPVEVSECSGSQHRDDHDQYYQDRPESAAGGAGSLGLRSVGVGHGLHSCYPSSDGNNSFPDDTSFFIGQQRQGEQRQRCCPDPSHSLPRLVRCALRPGL